MAKWTAEELIDSIGAILASKYIPDEVKLVKVGEIILTAEAEPWAPRAGQMHEVDKAFYDLTVKERDYERRRCDRLSEELDGIKAAFNVG